MVSDNLKKKISIYLMIGPIQHVVLTFIAMLLYAGGTVQIPSAPGYSFIGNYFSDLGRSIAPSGNDNIISMILFTVAFGGLALSNTLSFLLLTNYMSKKYLKCISIIGSIFAILSSISLVGVLFTPADLLMDAHLITAALTFFFMFFAGAIASLVILLEKDYSNQYALIFAIFTIADLLYMVGALSGPLAGIEGEIFQTSLQKMIIYTWVACFGIEGYGMWKKLQS